MTATQTHFFMAGALPPPDRPWCPALPRPNRRGECSLLPLSLLRHDVTETGDGVLDRREWPVAVPHRHDDLLRRRVPLDGHDDGELDQRVPGRGDAPLAGNARHAERDLPKLGRAGAEPGDEPTPE